MKAIQTEIIKRFMPEQSYKMFIQDYKEARKRRYQDRENNEDDDAIFAAFNEGKTVVELMKEWNRSRYQILRSITIGDKNKK